MVYRLKSCFKQELENFRDLKAASGIKDVSIQRYLNYFDDFINEACIQKIEFTKEMNDQWIKFQRNEGPAIRYTRVNYSIEFLRFLKGKGYDVYIPHRLPYVGPNIQHYIYTEAERDKYFEYIDSVDHAKDPMAALYIPVIFRILYACGTRVGETLSIKAKDVDLESGIILLRESKNGKERLIPVSDSLHKILKTYASKCLYLKNDDDYFFAHIDRRRVDEQRIYWIHRKALEYAGIPYVGNGKGPRVHDWRHTMAVMSLEQFLKKGADLYNVLPILKTYLGHTNIASTERYVHLVQQNYDNVLDKTIKTERTILGEEEYEKY